MALIQGRDALRSLGQRDQGLAAAEHSQRDQIRLAVALTDLRGLREYGVRGRRVSVVPAPVGVRQE
jgi:hypothetical protein